MAKLRQVRLAVHLPLRNRCHEDFEAMTPVTGGRACAACQRVVHDLSAMREREAARFVTERQGQRVCLRYLAREDGTIVYRREEPARIGPALVAAALAACTPHEPAPRLADEVEVVEAEAPVPAAVVVPAAAVASPPDDDINPCAPDPAAAPAAKKTPKKQRPKQQPGKPGKPPVEYVGFEG